MKKTLTIVSYILGSLSLVLLPLAVGMQKANAADTLPTSCKGITLTDELSLGSTGSSVTCLQALLNQSPDTQLATTGNGSPGKETTYFGSLTKKAVMAFQMKNAATILTPTGLKAGTGIVGPKTRDALNKMIADEGGSSVPTNPQ